MKGFIFALAFLTGAQSATATTRDEIDEFVKGLAYEVHQLTKKNISKLKLNDVQRILIYLKEARYTLSPRRPFPDNKKCIDEGISRYQPVFKAVKQYASSQEGLGLDGESSREFAESWIEGFKCKSSDSYIDHSHELIRFSRLENTLGYSVSWSRKYAKEHAPFYCSDYDLESKFRAHYDFARDPDGLGKDHAGARSYAKERVEKKAFKCNLD